jgi:hypothetical protein
MLQAIKQMHKFSVNSHMAMDAKSYKNKIFTDIKNGYSDKHCEEEIKCAIIHFILEACPYVEEKFYKMIRSFGVGGRDLVVDTLDVMEDTWENKVKVNRKQSLFRRSPTSRYVNQIESKDDNFIKSRSMIFSPPAYKIQKEKGDGGK